MRITADVYFTIIPEWVLYADISPVAVRLYGVLARLAGQKGHCIARRRVIAEKVRVHVSTMDRALEELLDIGAVSVKRRIIEGRQYANEYRVHVAAVTGRLPLRAGEEPPIHQRVDPSAPERTQEEEVPEPEVSEVTPSSVANDRPEIERLCSLLADEIEGNGAKRPVITKRWRDACRLMIDRDGRTPEQIEKAIRWSQGHEFWRSNILSMPKLREKYETLRLQASRSSTSNNGPGPYRNPQQEGAYEESVR